MSDQQEPEDLSTQILSEQRQTNALLQDLVGATRSATELVEIESEARKAQAAELHDQNRRTRRLLVLTLTALVILILTVAAVGYGVNQQQIDAAKTPCTERVETRNDIRSAIMAGVDEVGRYADLTPAEQADINDRVARRVYQTLPNPACAGLDDLPDIYKTCDDAKADGAAPIYASDPAYSISLDPDGDGVACD